MDPNRLLKKSSTEWWLAPTGRMRVPGILFASEDLLRAMDEKGRLLGLRELGGAEGCGSQACPIAHFAVPAGKCTVSVCLSDGRAAMKSATMELGKHRVVFREEEFK